MNSDEFVQEFRQRLRQAEEGKNEHGHFWNTKKLVEALRWFYDQVGDVRRLPEKAETEPDPGMKKE